MDRHLIKWVFETYICATSNERFNLVHSCKFNWFWNSFCQWWRSSFLSTPNGCANLAGNTIGPYTGNDYVQTAIQLDDRPFTAAATLKSFTISTSEETRQRITSHLSFGIMGPVAQGTEIQTGIHRIIGSSIPQGWGNQIKNQFILNYGIDYEKELIRVKNFFGLYANSSVKIGNLFTNATVGFNTPLGLINNPYQNTNQKSLDCMLTFKL